MNKRELAVKYAWSWIGKPCIQCEKNHQIFDCAWFVSEILRGVGLLKKCEDLKVIELYTRFKNRTIKEHAGSLLFYFNVKHNPPRASHVEILIDKHYSISTGRTKNNYTLLKIKEELEKWPQFPSYMIYEAVSRENARRRDSFVRLNPVGTHGGRWEICDPY